MRASYPGRSRVCVCVLLCIIKSASPSGTSRCAAIPCAALVPIAGACCTRASARSPPPGSAAVLVLARRCPRSRTSRTWRRCLHAPLLQVLHEERRQRLGHGRGDARDREDDEERHARGRTEDLAKLREGRGHRAQHGLEHDGRRALGALAQAERAKVGRGRGLLQSGRCTCCISPSSAIRSERTATYASTRHTTMRANVKKVRAAVIIANTRLGDAMALKTRDARLDDARGKIHASTRQTCTLAHAHAHSARYAGCAP